MNRSAPLALLAAGKIRDSFLTRLPRLEERLGPVRSSSYRLASRIANFLGAGYSVHCLEEFARSKIILISLPAVWLDPMVKELAAMDFDWKAKTVLLCEGQLDSEHLVPLAERGAATGSVVPVCAGDDSLFLGEGDRRALREARQLVEAPGVRLIAMDRGRKALFAAAASFATSLTLPMLAASVETMRASGVGQNEAQVLVERLFQRTMRAYLKGGRKGWEGPLPMQNKEAVRAQMEALFDLSPQLAAYFFENALMAAQLFRQDPKWLADLNRLKLARAASQ